MCDVAYIFKKTIPVICMGGSSKIWRYYVGILIIMAKLFHMNFGNSYREFQIELNVQPKD